MKKKIIRLIIPMLLIFLLVGCSADSYHGTMIISSGTSKSWDISWHTLNGRKSKKLSVDGEEKLEYDIVVNADEVKITVKQGDVSRELSLSDDEMSLEGFKDGKIQIIVEVKDAEESTLHFELK